MGLAYYGVKLSDNWIETPEKYVIFKNAVIARTGFQKYKGSEINQGELRQQGVTIGDDEEVELYRLPEEVFSPKTIASFETKSITDGHPNLLLTVDTVQQHEEGQITNVRRGSELLESGDFPLLADLVVKSRSLIEKIKAGLRELSCGYNYHILKQGNLLLQVDIIGNHVAIVSTGRAGSEASIKDSIESNRGAFNMSKFLDSILNKPTKFRILQWAKDAKPEEVADALDALASEVETKESKKVEGKDSEKIEGKDSKGKDRSKYHSALDRMLDSKDEEEFAADAEMEELKGLFNKKSEGKDKLVASEQTGKEMPEKPIEEGKDEEVEALTIEPEDRPKGTGEVTKDAANDAAYRQGCKDGAVAFAKALKPSIAASKNKSVIGAFDTAIRTLPSISSGTGSKGGYGAVAVAAQSVGKDAAIQCKNAEAEAYAAVAAIEAERRKQRN